MRRVSLSYALVLAVLIFQVVWLVLLFHALNLPPPTSEETRAQCDCAKNSVEEERRTVPSVTSQTHSSVAIDNSTHGGGVAVCTPSGGTRRPKYFLVVLVLSSVEGNERRNSIRATWMKGVDQLTPSVKVLFSVGTLDLSPLTTRALQQEQSEYGDMLLLPRLKESYYNLTRKLLHSFVWVNSNTEFSYLMKCDDDTFVRLELVLKELSEQVSGESLYWGFLDGRATAKKTGKWAEKDWFLCDKYLPYALGGGYVISGDLVHRVAMNAEGLQLYNSEDVSVGVWLSPFKAKRWHDVRFNTEYVSRGCRNQYLVSHKQTVEDMHNKFKSLQQTGQQCQKEFQIRWSYEYNWSVSPSQCCKRTQGMP